jgi:cell division protein FtsN
VDFTLLDEVVANKNSSEFSTVEEPESTYVDVVVPEVNYVETSEKSYFVIGGCFADKVNAETFVSDLKSKGFDAQLVDFHQGLHRVAFGQYDSRNDAKSAKSDITSSGEFSAWVLKK